MKNKKNAQLQLGENVVVLVIFFFLLVIAVIFYAGIQKRSFDSKQTSARTVALIDLKTMVSAMPEILCTENNDVTDGCIDLINLGIMKEYWASIKDNESSLEREYYIYRFGLSEITIKKLNPLTGVWTNSWTLYNNSGGLNYSRPVFISVSLYNATTDDYSFGILELRRFTKT